MRTESWVGTVLVLVVVSCGAGRSAEPDDQCLRLPANIELSQDLSRIVQDLSDRSPTFRAQCELLARADQLRVRVRIATSMPSRCRAYTTVTRQGREIRADVFLPPGRDLVELLAHEFEHLLEQVEGLDLRTLARTRGSGVRTIDGDLFESDRAVRVGRIVAAEASGDVRTRLAD